MQPKVKLLDQVRPVVIMRHLSPRTEGVYHNFIKRYILFHDKCYPNDVGAAEIRQADDTGLRARFERLR
ncbi:MAG: hypothetical protein M3R14_12955 [Acidobacteriota bacterium]|nr:hypothetical protein [Acidobacteriota bacterium]